MIGNKYLQALFNYEDEDTSINQLIEMLKSKDKEFIDSLTSEVPDLSQCSLKELNYLTKVSAIIDYYLQMLGLDVPNWLRSEKLSFRIPYYHSKRISDFDKFKLIYSSPAPFRLRNVYFDLEGLKKM